jgi:hypothetical protein
MKSGALVRAVWAVSFVVPVAVAAAPGDASACGAAIYREIHREIEDRAQLVAQAEQALSEGRFHKAAAKAIQAYPALKIVKPGELPLADRALRILALASVRSDGGLDVGGFKGRTAGDRATNLDWSVEILRGLNAKRVNNPSYQTDLGEAMAKVPSLHAEAVKLLGDLAAKDLVTTGEGYAALARLRAESGDNQARDEAVKRCEAMSKAPRLCAVPAGAVAVAAVAGQT